MNFSTKWCSGSKRTDIKPKNICKFHKCNSNQYLVCDSCQNELIECSFCQSKLIKNEWIDDSVSWKKSLDGTKQIMSENKCVKHKQFKNDCICLNNECMNKIKIMCAMCIHESHSDCPKDFMVQLEQQHFTSAIVDAT